MTVGKWFILQTLCFQSQKQLQNMAKLTRSVGQWSQAVVSCLAVDYTELTSLQAEAHSANNLLWWRHWLQDWVVFLCSVTNAQLCRKVVQSNKSAGDTWEEARGARGEGGGVKGTIQIFPELFLDEKPENFPRTRVRFSNKHSEFVKQFWRRTMSPRDYCHSQPRYYRITVRQSDSWCCPDNYSAAWISVEKLH